MMMNSKKIGVCGIIHLLRGSICGAFQAFGLLQRDRQYLQGDSGYYQLFCLL